MKLELLARIFDTLPGVRKEGTSFLVPDQVEVSVFVGLSSEVVTVTRVARAETAADLLTLETHKSERFYFPMADVAGVKCSAPEKRTTGRSAGF